MATPGFGKKRHKVTVIGSGNWGSTIAKIVAENTVQHANIFEADVRMWVYEEYITVGDEKQKLTDIINDRHENVKYLPGIKLPKNVIAMSSIKGAVEGSSILIFNLPHQFISEIRGELKAHIEKFARGISCIKGVNVSGEGISLFSERIGADLGIYCGALSGANIASEIAREKFSETTIAYDPPPMDSSRNPTPRSQSPAVANPDLSITPANPAQHKDARGRAPTTELTPVPPKDAPLKLTPVPPEYVPLDHETLHALFHRPEYFHVTMVSDVAGVSLGGALKNIVALAAGFVAGRGWGDNAKAAVMRVGLMEMKKFGSQFFGDSFRPATLTEESAGVADLITSCSSGRNFRCAKMSVERGVSVEEIERTELNGQMLQGTSTAKEVNSFLKAKKLTKEYPLFTAVSDILEGRHTVDDIPGLVARSAHGFQGSNSS